MDQALVYIPEDRTRAWVEGWIAEKAGRTGSPKTREAYTNIMASFQEFLWSHGLTLESPPAAVATAAQAWAAQPRPRKPGKHAPKDPMKRLPPVGNAAHNQRLAIISSFYWYLIKRFPEADIRNPLDRVQRRPIQENISARALPAEHVSDALAKIDQSTLEGKRDYALLLLALSTGRRCFELSALRWGDIEVLGSNHVIIRFRRCKGGKEMSDLLDPAVAAAIFAWLKAFYPPFPHLQPNAPLFVNLSRSKTRSFVEGKCITMRGISSICLERLGTGKVHTLRHTFAHLMEDSGAKISEIAARLGHENPAITGRYMMQLHRDENPYVSSIIGRLIKNQ